MVVPVYACILLPLRLTVHCKPPNGGPACVIPNSVTPTGPVAPNDIFVPSYKVNKLWFWLNVNVIPAICVFSAHFNCTFLPSTILNWTNGSGSGLIITTIVAFEAVWSLFCCCVVKSNILSLFVSTNVTFSLVLMLFIVSSETESISLKVCFITLICASSDNLLNGLT